MISDPIEYPKHYTSSKAHCSKCGEHIEAIQVTQHMNYCLGNAMKYIWRCDLKNDAIEDLKKAIWYLQQEVDRREKDAESK